MTANERILDREVNHQINVLGFSNRVTRRIIAILNRVDPDLMSQVIAARERLPESQFTVDRLDQLLDNLRRLNAQAYSEVAAELDTELRDLTQAEIDFQVRTIGTEVPLAVVAVAPQEVYSAAMARPFQGKLLSEWMSNLEEGKANAIRDAIRIGYIEGETTEQIVRRIRGTLANGYADGLLEITRRNAQAVVRTAVQHTAAFASEMVYEENADIVKAVKYSAVLDTRTTAVCRGRSGKIYPLGKPRPAIPAHMGCRSHYAPITKSFRELGLDADDFPASTQASLDGQVPVDLTYQTWLEKQSVARQNEVLGETKAKLFRDGGLKLDRFIDRQGREYTLDELRQRDAEAFTKAGL
jgi:SPP1 gp7 family putative phage head morphogenesis protein